MRIMTALVIVIFFGLIAYRSTHIKDTELSDASQRIGDKLGKLWDIAQVGMRENRFLRAEKALLMILKIDEKNAAAYNRLGILYAKQKEYKDAIDCFEIASSIDPSASSLHNLGLIYYETENYEKAGLAFEQALKLEDGLATRHIAYAKVQEKLGNTKLMILEIEKAVELEPNPETLGLLIKAYETNDRQEEANILKAKLNKLIMPAGKPRRVLRPRKVVI